MTNLSDIHSGGANHTITSHSDTSGTGTELDELTDGSETTLHNHVGGISWSVISTDTTASGGNGYLINASGGNINLTLLSSPDEGDTVGVCDAYNKASTNVITVVRGGENIEGLAEDMVISVDGAGFTLVYVDATRGWEIVSEIGSEAGSSTLIGLLDTPADYDDGKYLSSTASGTEWAAAGIGSVVEDTSPQLGGDLDTNGNDILFGTDTISGTGTIVTGDHGIATTAQVVNVVYGTDSPPAAGTTTEGTLFIKYTA